jgi:CelD/BcsL family acetyltransferase involved in cellulose biosynthesis
MALLPETAISAPQCRSIETAAGRAGTVASTGLTGAPARALLDADLEMAVVDTVEGLERLGAEWNALFECAGKAHHVFQQHAFVVFFARVYHRDPAESETSGKLAIVTARRSGRLVLIWPLVQHRCTGARVLSWLGEPIAQYGDVLVAPGEPVVDLLAAAHRHILTDLRPDVLRLRRVRADAHIVPFLEHLGRRTWTVHEAPCITLAAGGAAFEDRQSGKAKKNRRRLMRRLEERGKVAFEEVHGMPERARAIAAGLADKRDWIGRRGHFSPALSDQRFDAFLQSAAAAPGNPTGCAVFALHLDDRLVAFALGFRCRRRLMLHLISHAGDLEKHGVGVLNLEAILRHAEAEGLEALDMLPPRAAYKLDWSDVTVETRDYCWGETARGQIWSAFSEGLLRPVAKSAIERLPLAMRKRFARRQLLQHAFEEAPCA